jgi:hypothetical protein
MPLLAIPFSLVLAHAFNFLLVLAPFLLRYELPADTPAEPKRPFRFAGPIALGGACSRNTVRS